MKHIFLIVIPLILNFNNYSQKISIEYYAGLGHYKMRDLKEVNEQVFINLPFETKITENYPVYIRNKFLISYSLKNSLTFGIFYSYNATGSRIHYKDYSGEYRFDNIIASHMPGIDLKYIFFDNIIDLSFYTDAGIGFTSLLVEEELNVYESVDLQKYNFYARSIQIEPGIKAGINWKFINFGVYFGYLYDFNKNLHIKKNPEIYYYNFYMNSNIEEDWSGLRYGLSLSLNLYLPDLVKKQVNYINN